MARDIQWVALALLFGPQLGTAAEPSWVGKTVLLTRPEVKLTIPEKEKIAPRTAGVAKDLLFVVRKEEEGRLRIESRRQVGWIAREDAVLFGEAVAHFMA